MYWRIAESCSRIRARSLAVRVLERQSLAADTGEADGDDRVAAFLLEPDDHPFAPARVANARAHAERQIVSERLAEGRVRLTHDPAARLGPRVERRQVLLRHLAQEAGRLPHAVAVDTPVQRVREVEPLAGAGDANIAEPPLFLDLLGILQ